MRIHLPNLVDSSRLDSNPNPNHDHLPCLTVGDECNIYTVAAIKDSRDNTTGYHWALIEGGFAGATIGNVAHPKDCDKLMTDMPIQLGILTVVKESSNNVFYLCRDDNDKVGLLAAVLGNSYGQFIAHKKAMLATASTIFGQQSSGHIQGASNRIETVLRADPNYVIYLFELPELEEGKFTLQNFGTLTMMTMGLPTGN